MVAIANSNRNIQSGRLKLRELRKADLLTQRGYAVAINGLLPLAGPLCDCSSQLSSTNIDLKPRRANRRRFFGPRG